MERLYKSVRLRTETYNELAKQGDVSMTFDQTVSRLLKNASTSTKTEDD